MKMTVITDERGELVGATQGHAPRPDTSKASNETQEFRAGLMAGPGQTLHEIDVPDELGKIKDPDEFGRRLSQQIRERGLLS